MSHHAEHGTDATVKDPVCGMNVDPATTEHRHEHEGESYYFCSARCAEKFSAAPGDYLKPADATVKDPVCGISVDPLKSPHQHTLGGTRFSFCSVGCKDKFAANVGAYLSDYGLAPSAEGGPSMSAPIFPVWITPVPAIARSAARGWSPRIRSPTWKSTKNRSP